MRRFCMRVCALVLSLAVLTGGCSKGKQGQQVSFVLADVVNIENALITVATKNNLWAQEGIKLERRSFSSGKDALEAMLSGQADAAASAETPFIFAVFRGEPVTIVATLNRTVVKALGRKDAGVSVPADLKGKRVATYAGTSSDFWMNEWLPAHGLTKADLRLINLKPPEMVAAITRQHPDIDAFFAWEPHVVNAVKGIGADNATVFTSAGMYTEYFNLSCRMSYAAKNRETLRRVPGTPEGGGVPARQ
jgi:ABC-type nitrate/sulfonate/bicarbonate transport system substrate-binding protein